MKYIFLPGNSAGNKEWIDKLALEFDTPKEVIHYNHWKKGGKAIDFDEELDKLNQQKEDHTVISKSIGSILTLKSIEKGILNPKECYFIGFPLFYVNNHDVDLEKLLDNQIKITIIQKPGDPQAGYEDLRKEISKFRSDIAFIKYEQKGEPLDDHHYDDTNYLKKIITQT